MKIKAKRIFKNSKKLITIIIIVLIFSGISFYIGKRVGLNTDTSSSNTTIEDVKVSKRSITKTLTSSGQIEASSTEKLSLNTSYYFSSILKETDDVVKKGEKIVKYSNGKYLVAPYDLVITSTSLPNKGKKASSSNYIEVSKISDVVVNISINESEIPNINTGDSVDIVLTSDSSKKYTGKISKISSVGTYSSSGSTFAAIVSLKNDGNLKIGMSVSCTINIEEHSDVLAVPIGAVQINGDRRYVVVVEGNDTKEVDVTTGLSDDSYVEIKSGLTTNDTVRVVTVTKQNTFRTTNSRSSRSGMGGSNFPGGSMPSGSSFPGGSGNMPSGFPGVSSSSRSGGASSSSRSK